MTDDLRATEKLIASVLEDYPKGGLTWTLAKEIEQHVRTVSEQMEAISKMVHLLADRDAEIERLRAAGDALAMDMRHLGGLDSAYDAPLLAWEKARRGDR